MRVSWYLYLMQDGRACLASVLALYSMYVLDIYIIHVDEDPAYP